MPSFGLKPKYHTERFTEWGKLNNFPVVFLGSSQFSILPQLAASKNSTQFKSGQI